jgi:hypothetical protein
MVGDADFAHVVQVGALGQRPQACRPQPQPQADRANRDLPVSGRMLGISRRIFWMIKCLPTQIG